MNVGMYTQTRISRTTAVQLKSGVDTRYYSWTKYNPAGYNAYYQRNAVSWTGTLSIILSSKYSDGSTRSSVSTSNAMQGPPYQDWDIPFNPVSGYKPDVTSSFSMTTTSSLAGAGRTSYSATFIKTSGADTITTGTTYLTRSSTSKTIYLTRSSTSGYSGVSSSSKQTTTSGWY